VVKHLPSTHKALGSILRTQKRNKERKEMRKEGREGRGRKEGRKEADSYHSRGKNSKSRYWQS
jgi:hypothetical protein